MRVIVTPEGPKTAQGGFSMLEALVAALVLSLGILGVAGIQVMGVRTNFDAYNRSLATSLARDIIERIHVNQTAAQNGDYNGFDSNEVDCAVPPDPYCGQASGVADTDSCNSAEMAAFDTFVVSCGASRPDASRDGGVATRLPEGRLRVVCNDAPCTATSRYTVTITWANLDEDGEAANGAVNIGFLP